MLSEDNGLQYKGILYFDLKVHDIYFNKKGKYLVKLSINSSRGDLNKVKLYLNNSKTCIYDFEYTSEPCYQEDLNMPCQLDDTHFRFEMPEEFSEGEVFLLFETYKCGDNPLTEPFKCGEGKFLIFPSAAPIQSKPSTSKDNQVCCNFTTQIIINSLLQDEQVYVNIGQVSVSVLLEAETPELSRNMSISSKSRKMVSDPTLPSNCQGPPLHHLCGSYLNDIGYYEVIIQVHSACNLPSSFQGRPPQPYVTGKTTDDEQGSSMSQGATHVSTHPTYSPFWDELLVLKVPKEKFPTQELILCIVDHLARTLISSFRLPLQPLLPFHPYHLEMEQVGSDTKAKLFITIMLKADDLRLPSLHSEIFGLEVVLRHFTSPLADNCSDPLVAVVRIVSSFSQYRKIYLDSNPRAACVKTSKLRCPSSDLVSKLASFGADDQHNVPQITFAGEPSEQPKWNQMLFFHGDDRSLFSHFSALVIEYYTASQVVSFGNWQPRSPVGFSFFNLDSRLLSTLRQENASMGVRVNSIAIHDSSLKSKAGEPVTVNVILRLITNKRPDPMIPAAHYNILPVIDVAATKPIAHLQNLSHVKYQIGKHDVVEPVAEATSATLPPGPLPTINQHAANELNDPTRRRSNTSTENPNINPGPDSSVFSLMEYQTKELEKHRYAMKKMADDIIQLKSEATRLQAANSRLRLELERRSERNHYTSLPSHFENTTHAELVQRIVIIKGSLDEQTAINREQRLEIQSLQNQLIKKNEKEKDFYKLQEAHRNQQVLLQKMQERLRRTKTLEETCKRQEKVIMRLEDFLANPKTKEKEHDKKSEDEHAKTVNEALLEENKRLRAQLLNYERTSKAVEDMERLQVHEKLQRAEGRVAALEKELLENTRRWARDKAELQLKLSETQMSQRSGHWQYPSLSQEPFSLFDRTPPDSQGLPSRTRLSSPKLSPLAKK